MEKDRKKKEKNKKEQKKLKKEQKKKIKEDKIKVKKSELNLNNNEEIPKLPPIPPIEELSKMFLQLLQDLEIPQTARDEMLKNYSNQMKWEFLFQHKLKMDNTVMFLKNNYIYFFKKIEKTN